MFLVTMQAPVTVVQSGDEGTAIETLKKAQQWGALADCIETLSPKERGAHLNTWLQALQRAERWNRLLEICNAALPQLEVQTGPKLSIPRLERAQALSALNRHAEAEAAHELNGQLGYSDGYINACVEARNSLDWPGLERCAKGILVTRPSDNPALASLGEALARQQRFAEAEPLLRKSLAGDPNQPLAWNNLGRCLTHQQAWPEAVEVLDKALALDPKLWEALYNRGLAQFRLGHYGESLKDLKAANAANPTDPQIKKDLAEVGAYVRSHGKTLHHAAAQ